MSSSTTQQRNARAEAAILRIRASQSSPPTVPSRSNYQDHDGGLFDRLQIRRNLNTLLVRHGVATLKTLRTIARNILLEENLLSPDSKYKTLKLESEGVKKKLVSPEGVLEVVIDMGFRKSTTVEHEEHRIWIPKYEDRLRLYEQLLDEAVIEAPINEARRNEEVRIKREQEEKEDSRQRELRRFKEDRTRVKERVHREKHMTRGQPTVTEDGRLSNIGTPGKTSNVQDESSTPQRIQQRSLTLPPSRGPNIHGLGELTNRMGDTAI
ncbi:hypothetical protein PQX77_019217 [Marasmius sp. AFHP31]|nr:hypothetical protein PQX77_019217 [Marasmius sp. AFHP31]